MSRKQQPGDDPPVVDAAPIFSLLASLARAADVKWLESGGARVVPIRFDSPPAATSALLASLNGVERLSSNSGFVVVGVDGFHVCSPAVVNC